MRSEKIKEEEKIILMEENLKVLSKENENLKIKLKIIERNTSTCQEDLMILNSKKDIFVKENQCFGGNFNSAIFFKQEDRIISKKKEFDYSKKGFLSVSPCRINEKLMKLRVDKLK